MRSAIRQTVSTGVLVTALAFALTACGSDSSTVADPGGSSTSTSTTPVSDEPTQGSPAPSSASPSPAPSGPDCTAVWKAGATLARSYDGCVQAGDFVQRDAFGCSSGQRIVRYDDHYYAALGGLIYRTESVLDKDRGYRNAVAVCRG